MTVWNVRDRAVEWVDRYEKILASYEGDTPRHSTMEWRWAINSDDRFAVADDWAVDNPQTTNVDGVVARAMSTSFIAALPAEEQARVSAQVRQLVEPLGPELAFPYRSELQAWQRL